MKSTAPDDDGSEEDRFATLQMGVQKLGIASLINYLR